MAAEDKPSTTAPAAPENELPGEEVAWDAAEQEWRESQRLITRRFRPSRPVAETPSLAPRFWARYWALVLGGVLLLGVAALALLR